MQRMNRRSGSRRSVLMAVGLGLLVLGACSKAAENPAATTGTPAAAPAGAPAPAPAPAPSPAAAPAAAPTAVLARQAFNSDPDLSCEILEVRRVAGGALLVRWRLIRPRATAGLAADAGPAIWHTWNWGDVYFTDAAENKKYSGLRDSAGNWLGQGDGKHYKPGDQQAMWLKFPAPPETTTRITFVFSGFPPFEDVPVAG
jgi:hypothetical protein